MSFHVLIKKPLVKGTQTLFCQAVKIWSVPLQEEFVRMCEHKYVISDTKKNTVEHGWFSKDDMLKELKWSAPLRPIEIYFIWSP